MAVGVGRLVAGEWVREKLYRLISPLTAPASRAFPRAAACSAPFCTDAEAALSSRVKIFDRDLKRKQRDRAAWVMGGRNDFVDSVAENLLDRLQDCKNTFSTALCLGGSSEAIRRLIRGRGGIEKLIMMDMSFDMIKYLKDTEQNNAENNFETLYVVGDEEFLPIKENSLELVVSCLGLHWTNDLPGAMIQCRLALKPDGLFLAAILGGETLKELRMACTIAQLEREGGISPRMSPLAQVRDAGNLLTRAGFALPGVDVEEYTVRYDSALELIEHLRSMAETNALLQRSKILKRETALATAAVYDSMFAAEDGKVPATFQVIYMTGWKEHPSQQKAKARGSATISFEDIQKHFGSSENNKILEG
ncbi:putative methyltransferase At1g22800 isoform X1 [Phalaenopsis equestris]|uniref:putative methyltransferase At1g22800 isoform X1 n=1 Tax=Phalaenopsis equestris TaxID=78828 RepID=UPI0009E25F25|nr:putative methyltransferase At1g22800 isoform X1 [Phalaenopsis equestris]